MGDEGFIEVAQYRGTLQPARLHHGQHPFHEAAAKQPAFRTDETPAGVAINGRS